MQTNKFKELLYKSDYFIDGIDALVDHFCKNCPECFTINYRKELPRSPKIIFEEGPHYRMLIDITYLEKNLLDKKIKYKYIIDSIDHFSKFYWGFLIEDKKSNTVLNKIKLFIQINPLSSTYIVHFPRKVVTFLGVRALLGKLKG